MTVNKDFLITEKDQLDFMEAKIRADERKKVLDEAISRISNLIENEYDERDEAHNNGIDHAIAELELMKGENRIPRRHQYAR